MNTLSKHLKKSLLKVAVIGNVDDGKSTFMGQFLLLNNMLHRDTLNDIYTQGKKRDLAFITDGLEDERKRGITIDVAYRYMSTKEHRLVFSDVPGHEIYTKNMVSGVAGTNFVILLIDVRKPLQEQTKRHFSICQTLGINHFLIAINKMDLTEYSESSFNIKKEELKKFFLKRYPSSQIDFIPISALYGDNLKILSPKTKWYRGPCVSDYIDNIETFKKKSHFLRIFIQGPLKNLKKMNLYAGTIVSGSIQKGDFIKTIASEEKIVVHDLLSYEGKPLKEKVSAPSLITLNLSNDVILKRGDTLISDHNSVSLSDHYNAELIWIGDKALTEHSSYWIKHSSQLFKTSIEKIITKFNFDSLQKIPCKEVHTNEIATVKLKMESEKYLDSFLNTSHNHFFTFIDHSSKLTVAVGLIKKKGQDDACKH